jgi:hypothetical protein
LELPPSRFFLPHRFSPTDQLLPTQAEVEVEKTERKKGRKKWWW